MALKWKKSPAALRRAYFARKRAVEREALGALGRAVGQLEAQVKLRVFPAKAVNKQDAPGNRQIKLAGKKPIRTRIVRSQRMGVVAVQRHYTPVRTRKDALTAVFEHLGLGAQLLRKALVVRNKFQPNVPAQRIPLSRNKRLRQWAERTDRGYQIKRHVVRLKDPRVIRLLQLTPSVTRTIPFVSRLARDVLRSAK